MELSLAAFEQNDKILSLEGHSKHRLSKMTIPCISVSARDFKPMFYLVSFVEVEGSGGQSEGGGRSAGICSVDSGSSQRSILTTVLKCTTEPTNAASDTDSVGDENDSGMGDPKYRQLVFRHLLAFKEVAKAVWAMNWIHY